MDSSTATARRRLAFRKYLYFVVALLLISIALGTLSRSQAGGGTWLANSYWVLFVIELLPLISLAAMIVIIVFLALNLRSVSDALGDGMKRRQQNRRSPNKRVQAIVYMASWATAIVVLWIKCNGIPCRPVPEPDTIRNLVFVNQTKVGGPAGQALSILLGASATASSIVQSEWFTYAFLGIIILSAVLFVRTYKVALTEYRKDLSSAMLFPHSEGLRAIKDAIQIVQESQTGGPRERIMACYDRMIKGAYDLGAHITPDQTARELENTIRRAFMINSKGIRTLTGLFEEARYSLHPMTEADSQEAYSSLVLIESELMSFDKT